MFKNKEVKGSNRENEKLGEQTKPGFNILAK